VVERLLGGDWRSTVAVAIPTAVVLYALAALASTYLFWLGADEEHSKAGFFHGAGWLAAMAMGSPIFLHGRGDNGEAESAFIGIAPLTISVLVLVVFALLLRSYLPNTSTSARLASAVRAALLAAVAVTAVGCTAYANNVLGEDSDIAISPGRIFGWSLLCFVVVGGLVAIRSGRKTAVPADDDSALIRLAATWWLPVQGAIALMATAVVLGGVAAIVAMFVEAGDQPLDVVKALPLVFAYFVNLGVDVFQFAMGAPLGVYSNGPGSSDGSAWLFDRHGVSAGYIALVVLPPLAVTAGVLRIRRFRHVVDPRHLARSCYRMALPALLLYLAVALPSRAGFGFEDPGRGVTGHAGPNLLLGSVILVAWVGVLGYAAGRWLLRDAASDTLDAVESPPTAAPRRSSARRVHALPLTLGALAVVVATTAGGVATAEDRAESEGAYDTIAGAFFFVYVVTSDGSIFEDDGSPPEPRGPAPVANGNDVPADVQRVLAGVTVGEEVYFSEHGEYTNDASLLTVDLPVGMQLVITAGDGGYCALVTTHDGSEYSYATIEGDILEGSVC
jgi:hypothetical protein